MRSVALLALALVLAGGVLFACSSFDAAAEPNVDVEPETSTSDAAPPIDSGATCAPSEVSAAAPSRDCLGPGQPLVDLMSSPLHCGRCNHSCRGAMCNAGICSPSMVRPSSSPFVGDVTASHVFYTSGSEVQRLQLGDGGVLDVIARAAAGYGTLSFVRQNDSLVVTTSNGNFIGFGQVASIASGDAGIVPIVAASSAATHLAADTTNVYWSEYATVKGASKTGSGFVVQANSGNDYVAGLVSDDDELYWTVQRQVDGGGFQTLLYARTSDGTVTERAKDLGATSALALDATHVYWADIDAGAIMRVGRAGTGVPSVVARSPGPNKYVKAMVVAGDTVYWTLGEDAASGSDVFIYQAPTCAAAGTVFATARPQGEFFRGLVADATHLYYGGGSGVWQVAR